MTVVPETQEAPAATPAGLLDRLPIVALRVVQFAVDLALVARIILIPRGLDGRHPGRAHRQVRLALT